MPVAVEVTKLEDDRVKVDVAVPEDEVRKQFDRTVKEVSSRMRIPGFRPGKAPAAIVRKQYADAIRQETLEGLMREAYLKVIESEKLEPVTQPHAHDVSFESQGDTGFRPVAVHARTLCDSDVGRSGRRCAQDRTARW